MKTMPLALVAACLILGACEKAPSPPAENDAFLSEVLTSSSESSQSSSASNEMSESSVDSLNNPFDTSDYLTYHCDNGKSVAAAYSEGDDMPAATLVIDDKKHVMYRVVSASGARYASEQGLLPNEGMQWYVKDDEAMLVAMVLDDTANPDDAQILFRCQLAQAL